MKPYDFSKLLGKMRERGETQTSIAAMLGISPVTLYGKLHNKTEFTRSEIAKICERLGIDDPSEYFFAH